MGSIRNPTGWFIKQHKTGQTVVRVPNLYFGSRLGVQYPKNSKIFL